jgi:hypothetical protein
VEALTGFHSFPAWVSFLSERRGMRKLSKSRIIAAEDVTPELIDFIREDLIRTFSQDYPTAIDVRLTMKPTKFNKDGVTFVIEGIVPDNNVEHPPHYNQYEGVEVWDLVRQMDFNLGNAVKYICRAGFKDPRKEIEDLEKAVFYIKDEIEHYPVAKPESPARYGKLVFTLISQMNEDRGRAVEFICRGSTNSLRVAINHLRMEIDRLKGSRPPRPTTTF